MTDLCQGSSPRPLQALWRWLGTLSSAESQEVVACARCPTSGVAYCSQVSCLPSTFAFCLPGLGLTTRKLLDFVPCRLPAMRLEWSYSEARPQDEMGQCDHFTEVTPSLGAQCPFQGAQFSFGDKLNYQEVE